MRAAPVSQNISAPCGMTHGVGSWLSGIAGCQCVGSGSGSCLKQHRLGLTLDFVEQYFPRAHVSELPRSCMAGKSGESIAQTSSATLKVCQVGTIGVPSWHGARKSPGHWTPDLRFPTTSNIQRRTLNRRSRGTATPRPPSGYPEAIWWLTGRHPEATLRLPRGYPEATLRLP